MSVMLALCYAVYILVEMNSMSKNGTSTFGILRCVYYVLLMLIDLVMLLKKADTRLMMFFLACTFTMAYAMFVFENWATSLVLVFPALIGFMLYLNALLVVIGCIISFLICILRCMTFQ